MKIEYLDFRGGTQRKQAEAAVNEWLDILPWWVATVLVFRATDDNESIATASCEREYRRIKVFLQQAFFAESEQEQRCTVCHELAHAVLAPITVEAESQLLDPREDDNPEWYALAKATFRASYEGVVEDLAQTLTRLKDGQK